MSVIASAISGSGGLLGAGMLGSGILGAGANLIAGSGVASAEQQAIKTIQQMLNQGTSQVQGAIAPATQAIQQGADRGVATIGQQTQQGVAALQPYAGAGSWALPQLQSLLTPGQMPDLSQIPGFAESLYWGGQAVNNNATATTGLGGNQLAALQSFGGQQGMNAYNQLVSNTFNTAQLGSQAAGNIGQLYGNAGTAAGGLQATAGTNIGGVYTGAGNTIAQMMQAAGGNMAQAGVGAATASGASYTGAAQSLSNPLMMMSLLQGLNKKGATNT